LANRKRGKSLESHRAMIHKTRPNPRPVPFEICLGHTGAAAEGCAVLLAAHRAVAIARTMKGTVYFEFDAAI
jgi:hypothetical protein